MGLKARLFNLSTRIPLVGETADPWIFLVLTALVAVATFGILFPDDIFPGDEDARGHVIQVAAGLLVILGAYFTAVNIREIRAQQSFERICRVIEQLGSDSEAVRMGAVRLLESLLLERLDLPGGSAGAVLLARREAILAALAATVNERAGSSCAELAQRVLRDRKGGGEGGGALAGRPHATAQGAD